MAYNNTARGRRNVGWWFGDPLHDPLPPNPTSTGNGSKDALVSLGVGTSEGVYECFSPKQYVDKYSIIQELDNNDGFITLSEFSKSLGALTVNNAKVIVVKNLGNIAIEVAVVHYDWRNDSGSTTTDVANIVDINEENGGSETTNVRVVSFILPANEFIYLPTSRIIGYQP